MVSTQSWTVLDNIMAKIKFFQQNSSVQACLSKPGLGESSSVRQHNYRAIRGVNFSSSPAQHLFSLLQSSVKASHISFAPNNSHWLNYHQQEHCSHTASRNLGMVSQSICQRQILISGRILHFLEKGEIVGVSCSGPGAGCDDPHVSLPA